MEIETKYNISDKLWMMRYNMPIRVTVRTISIYVKKGSDTKVMYGFFEEAREASENDLYPTKEDLINSL